MDDIMEKMHVAEAVVVFRLNEVSPSLPSDIGTPGYTDDDENNIGLAVRKTTQTKQDEAIRDHYPLFPRASLSSSTPRVVQAPGLRV